MAKAEKIDSPALCGGIRRRPPVLHVVSFVVIGAIGLSAAKPTKVALPPAGKDDKFRYEPPARTARKGHAEE